MPENIALENWESLIVEKRDSEETFEISISVETDDGCVLHWGFSRGKRPGWQMPPEKYWPKDSRPFGEGAVQSIFDEIGGKKKVEFRIDKEFLLKQEGFNSLSFVIYYPRTNRWDNNKGKNYAIRFGEGPSGTAAIIEEIAAAEAGDHSWTLMHRFKLCHDLIEGLGVDGLAVLFVWLRFSALRQLTWQRRFNTKPGELSHAQDRLTLRLASIYRDRPESREIVRMMLGTVGRGGEGQRIRDEILHIMHRHHVKEVTGHFLEEWHQKLHNNSTPDDIVICEAYIEFLKRNGDKNVFYSILEKKGVTRSRLEGFERPIVSEPDFVHHLKDPLIYDFENYLKVLKSVHSANDLETAFNATRRYFNGGIAENLSYIIQNREGRPLELIRKITETRTLLSRLLDGDDHKMRDILYLDLSLEEFLRLTVERGTVGLNDMELYETTGMAIENLSMSFDDEEFASCSDEWRSLGRLEFFTYDWCLRARAVLERIGRAVANFSDRFYKLLQPNAEFLGRAFGADSWTITLFSEEVVRGMPAFVLSMLLHYLDPVLRKKAKLGNWQVINPGQARGRVNVVGDLSEVQGKSLPHPTILIAERVKGDEEPPEGASAIITTASVDLVSHVAVRTRNARLLFATCFDKNSMERLKSMQGQFISMSVNTSGDIIFEEDAGGPSEIRKKKLSYEKIPSPIFSGYAIMPEKFAKGIVGGKSLNLKMVEGNLPEWINRPASVAVPYGVFDQTLNVNGDMAERYGKLIGRLEAQDMDFSEILKEIRGLVLSLRAPASMMDEVKDSMLKAGMGFLDNEDDAFRCIKEVWASKWNDRAYISRKNWRFPHEDLHMAVLIQEVVDAEYAYVIHTVNPATLDREEIYAEVVIGLGETLVGNYPGRAFSFSANKSRLSISVGSYPSKSKGLFGKGIIFRSDSSAEDLPGYAGAGLYDSIMLPLPKETVLNYTNEPLLWDEGFRKGLMQGISEIGLIVEKAMGSPQDIEGAYSAGKHYMLQTRPQVGL